MKKHLRSMVRELSRGNPKFSKEYWHFPEAGCQNSQHGRKISQREPYFFFLKKIVRFLKTNSKFRKMNTNFPKKNVKFHSMTEYFGRGREDFLKKIVKIESVTFRLRSNLI